MDRWIGGSVESSRQMADLAVFSCFGCFGCGVVEPSLFARLQVVLTMWSRMHRHVDRWIGRSAESSRQMADLAGFLCCVCFGCGVVDPSLFASCVDNVESHAPTCMWMDRWIGG